MFRHWTKQVKATHTPTGTVTVVEGGPRDSLAALEHTAKLILAMRVLAAQHELPVTHEYNLPDDQPYPNELGTFRERVGLTPQNAIGHGPGGNLT
jgi:hypothetical protein